MEYLNQDETDTDCGGRCEDCPEYYHCKADSDCETGNCENKVCMEEPQQSSGDSGDSGSSDFTGDDGGAWGEDITWGDIFKAYWMYMAAGLFLLIALIVFIVAIAGSMRGG